MTNRQSYQIRWRAANAERIKKYSKSWNRKNRLRKIASKLGVSPESLDILLQSQNYRCAICCRELSRNLDKYDPDTHVDHDHDTGRVRGILCRNCNLGLGMLGDSLQMLRRAVSYLEK